MSRPDPPSSLARTDPAVTPGARARGAIGVLLLGVVLTACGTGTSTVPEPDGTADGSRSRVPLLHTEADAWPETTVTLGSGDTVDVKVAEQPARRSQGLMGVAHLPEGVGMLFVFEGPRTGGFWMKDTLVPLDIAYLRDGEVVAVRQMEPCEAAPCPTYDAGAEFDAALEVNQGALEVLGVEAGSRLTWPEPVEVTA